MTVRDIILAAAGAGSTPTPPATNDPQFPYVTMLLHGDGTNGAQNNTFVSEPVVAPGGVGYLAGLFNGTDYLSVASNVALAAGAGAFTYETWFYPFSFNQTSSAGDTLFIVDVSSGLQVGKRDGVGGNSWGLASAGVAWRLTTTTQPINNTWNHIVVVRSGTGTNQTSIFLNGVRVANGTVTDNFAQGTAYIGGGPQAGALEINGYLSNTRLVKGTAVYDPTLTTLTMPTSPLTAISGTSLLTCQSGSGSTFADDSANNFTITRTGTPTMVNMGTMPGGTYTGYFPGSGAAAYAASPVIITTTPFTIEAWIYTTAYPSSYGNFIWNAAWSFGNNRGYAIYMDSTGKLLLAASQGVWNSLPFLLTTTATTPLNQWVHVACVRDSSNVIKFYINGVADASTLTYSASLDQIGTNGGGQGTYRFSVGSQYADGAWQTGSSYFGYVNNLRVSNSTAFYTSNFAPPATALTAITGTSLLTFQNATFVDNSTNAYAMSTNGSAVMTTYNAFLPTITRNGTPTQGSFSPYGTLWSDYFDGASLLTVNSPSAINIGTNSFTFETWMYYTGSATGGYVFSVVLSDGTNALDFRFGDVGFGYGLQAEFGPSAISSLYAGPGGVFSPTWTKTNAANMWLHLAFVRNGGTGSFYVNGSLVQSQTGIGGINMGATTACYIGASGPTTNFFTGYLSNTRLVVGTALYTANFTPPTVPLTAVSGTALLSAQSNRFIDNSSNNFAITVTGTPSVQRFSPFEPSTGYTTSVIGGSGYFNGSTDSINTPTSAAVLGTGDWTFECYVYLNAKPAFGQVMGMRKGVATSADQYVPVVIAINATGFAFYSSSNSTSWDIASAVAFGGTAAVNQWYHVAIVRSGSTIYGYANGVQTTLVTGVAANYTSTNSVFVGGAQASDLVNGYVTNARVVKGTAVYTATFTPPTAPLTAPLNTSLLLNCVNAGIYDNAMMNDLVTVGDAQVSTAVKKYGTGSIKFDGAGDYMTTITTPNLQFGTGNFTVEFWMYFIARDTLGACIFSNYNSFTTGALSFFAGHNTGSATKYQVACNGTFPAIQSTATVTYNQWDHFAIVRSGSTLTLYINGVADGTFSVSGITLNGVGSNWIFGAALDALTNYELNGYIDDLRITKGYARYTANFTPPTAAFPNY